MITFEKFNETANYYSKTSRTTGCNVWNQDEIQRLFTELIFNCNLTKEQTENLEAFMIGDNATIDMIPTKNNSAKDFSNVISLNKDIVRKTM